MAQLRNTQQKKLISELMQDNISHPTADDIYLRARTIDAHISRGTVYRNLNLLAAQGSIRRINTVCGPDHYDCRTDSHYHFVCDDCGKMYDIPVSYDDALDVSAEKMANAGFKVNGHRLIFTGECPECAMLNTVK